MKVGDIEQCIECGSAGVVVATTLDGDDFDRELSRRVALPLEPSAYVRGLTCRSCETLRLKEALPRRGVCPACGKQNLKATLQDLGGTRGFCDDQCLTDFANRRTGGDA